VQPNRVHHDQPFLQKVDPRFRRPHYRFGGNEFSLNTKTARIIPFEGPRELATVIARLPVLFLPEPKASERFWEFFTANIRNRNTRRAYYRAACRFSEWCEGHGLHDLARVKPIHVAGFIEELLQELSKPTVKQHLPRCGCCLAGPGVFCAGDVRHNSIKRVLSGVGEGSMAIAFIHQYLALQEKIVRDPTRVR
jgi:hypothetical protein